MIEFALGALVGLVVAALTRRRPQTEVELPIDSMLTFAIYDEDGNQLTERVPFSIGGDGRNPRSINAPVIRSGVVHHGISFVGEYGMVMEVAGDRALVRGDVYRIEPGNWATELKPL